MPNKKYFLSATSLNIKTEGLHLRGYVISKPGHNTPCQASEVLMRWELLSVFQDRSCLSGNSRISVISCL